MTDSVETTYSSERSSSDSEGLRALRVETGRYARRAPTPRGLGTLVNAPLFASLAAEDVRTLDSRCVWRRVAAGDWVVSDQWEGTDVHFVVSGRARILTGSTGREIIFGDIGDGQYIGELSAIGGVPYPVGVRAITDAVVARMSASVFRETIDRHPSVRDNVLSTLAHIARKLAIRASEHTHLHVRERLCAELLRLSRTSAAGRLVVSPPPPHAELAARIGTHREAVTRSLKALERDGAIARSRSAIVLVDADYLREAIAKAS